MSFVSVIIPNYNHAIFLQQRIESVLSQSFQNFEMIIIDDCSTDDSRAIIETYRNHPKVSQIVYNEQNSGSAFKQWINGISLAKGEWVWIAESDDWAEHDFLERMIQAVTENPTCGLVYCRSFYTNEKGERLWPVTDEKKTVFHQGETFIRETLSCYNAIVNVSSCMYKSELFIPEKVALYERMRLCGDWFFYVLLAEKADVVEVQSPLNYCRRHGANISENAETRGLTFLEGADVLDYILDHHSVKKSYYSRFWGRQWAKYEKQWGFSAETNTAIRKRLRVKHRSIIRYHGIYLVRNLFRRCRK